MPLLRVVAEAEKRILEAGEPHTYLPISGIPAFTSGVQKLILGADSPIIKEKRAVTVQSLGGTGALKVGADFLAAILKDPQAVVSTPTWQNHVAIFEQALVSRSASIHTMTKKTTASTSLPCLRASRV